LLRRSRHCRALSSIRRWLAVALATLLVIGVLARGHVFQSLGIPFGCEHPAAEALEQQDDHSESTDDTDCPRDCHRCPCGQIPMVPPTLDALLYEPLAPYELEDSTPPDTPGQSLPCRLDRPPRRPLV
jgi:hypothetical protein